MKIQHYLMQVQLLLSELHSSSDIPSSGIPSGALICSSNSSPNEMLRRAKAESWQSIFGDA